MTMSASFSSKMIRSTIAVTLTGSISGKVISQKDCQAVAPSTLAASFISFGSACRPASSRIIMKGIETQASIAMMLMRAIQGSVKKAGLSQPRQRASFAAGPKRYSIIDLPIIQLTATGLSMNGSRKATRKNLRARMSALSSSARPKAMRVLHEHGQHVEDHVAERVPEDTGRANSVREIVEAVEMAAARAS